MFVEDDGGGGGVVEVAEVAEVAKNVDVGAGLAEVTVAEDDAEAPVLVAVAAIAESVESLLGSVRGTTNDADADVDAEGVGGVNVRGKGVVMGGGGCA